MIQEYFEEVRDKVASQNTSSRGVQDLPPVNPRTFS